MDDYQFQQLLTQAPMPAGGESSSADETFLNSACDDISFTYAAIKSPIPNPRVEKIASYTKQWCRHRQQRPNDKMRCLQKLLPWDGKEDMATVLEEAYKYVKFLRVEVSVLQSMTCESNSSASAAATSIGCAGMLGKLNRQQLLQVAVSSLAVQTQLYSKGCCLYSMEKLMLLKKKALYHRMISDPFVKPDSFLFRN